MSYPIRLDGILAKIEGTYATDPTPSASVDGVRLSERIWNNLVADPQFPNSRDDSASGTLLPIKPGTPRGWVVTLDFGVELKGAGAAYASNTLPEVSPLLKCCGMSEAITTTGGSEKVEYSPADTSHGSTTIWAYAAGKKYIINGCRGTVRWPWAAG